MDDDANLTTVVINYATIVAGLTSALGMSRGFWGKRESQGKSTGGSASQG